MNSIFDRAAKTLPLEAIPADWIEAGGGKESVPIITHCGGGGRGQKVHTFPPPIVRERARRERSQRVKGICLDSTPRCSASSDITHPGCATAWHCDIL